MVLPGGVSRCPRHEAAHQERRRVQKRDYEQRRPERALSTSDGRWRGLRVAYLRQHPFCAECGGTATEVHHRVPVRVRPDLALEWANLVALCKPHHAAITARENAAERQERAKCP